MKLEKAKFEHERLVGSELLLKKEIKTLQKQVEKVKEDAVRQLNQIVSQWLTRRYRLQDGESAPSKAANSLEDSQSDLKRLEKEIKASEGKLSGMNSEVERLKKAITAEQASFDQKKADIDQSRQKFYAAQSSLSSTADASKQDAEETKRCVIVHSTDGHLSFVRT